MTADAFSDLILCMAACWLAQSHRQTDKAFALAVIIIGAAAALGVVRFSPQWGWVEMVQGSHRFLSTAGALVAFPLWALSLKAPDSPINTRWAGAWRFILLFGGVSFALVLIGANVLAQAIPVLAVLIMAQVLWQSRQALSRAQQITAWAGWISLLVGFGAALGVIPTVAITAQWDFSPTQVLHYTLALALILLAPQRLVRSKASQ